MDYLLKQYPQAAWAVLISAFRSFSTRTVRSAPQMGEAKPDGWKPDTASEMQNYHHGLLDRLLSASGTGPVSRLIDLIPQVEGLPGAAQLKLADQIEQAAASTEGPARIELSRALDHFADRYEAGYTSPRLSTDLVAAVSRAARVLEDSDLISQCERWFSDTPPRIPGIPITKWEDRERALRDKRKALVALLLASGGVSQAAAQATQVKLKWDFGFALASCTSATEDEDLRTGRVAFPASEPAQLPVALWGYAAKKFEADGEHWLVPWLDACAQRGEFADEICATMLLVLPPTASTWSRVSSFGPKVEALYWSWSHGVPAPSEDVRTVAYATEKLCSVDRADVAFRIVSQRSNGLPGSTLVKVADAVLKQISRRGMASMASMSEYYTEQLFKSLDQCQDVQAEDMIRLEWAYLRVLEHTDLGPRELHKLLAKSAKWFVRFVSMIWRPRGKEVAPFGEHEQRQADQAYALLSNWSAPLPGQTESGIDEAELKAWVTEARRLLSEADLEEIGDDRIGKILSAYPPDPDDTLWPHRAVRSVLDEMPKDVTAEAFWIGKRNRRGVTTRSPSDGGEQERVLSHEYEVYSSRMHNQLPRTADILAKLASSYLADAKWHDDEVARRQL